MGNKSILKVQLDRRIAAFAQVDRQGIVWLRSLRNALGISLTQMAAKLSIAKQTMAAIEAREKEGSVTIKTMREVASALEMDFVYGFVPKAGTLEKLIENKARQVATDIVLRTSGTMALEDQENSQMRLKAAVEEMTEKLKKEIPKHLWD